MSTCGSTRPCRFPRMWGATLVSTSIVTERQIEFTQPYRGGEHYESAKCIPLNKTRTPLGGISQTLDAISTLSDELVKDGGRNTDAILQALTLVSKNMEGTQGDISGILKDSATLINDPTRRDGQIRRIVANLATLTGVATENSAEVTQLFDNFVGAIEVIVAFGQTFGGRNRVRRYLRPPHPVAIGVRLRSTDLRNW